MRLLIVDDNIGLAEITADLLWSVDKSLQTITSISVAGDLESALAVLPSHDAVLCDGEFPTAPGSTSIGEEWVGMFRETCKKQIPFILYSASPTCLEDAHCCDIPAVSKPATIEQIYSAIMEHCTSGAHQQLLHEVMSQ